MTDYKKLCDKLRAENERLKKERDAAVHDLKESRGCNTCKFFCVEETDEPCCSCERSMFMKPKWKWRGVAPDEEGEA